MPASLATVNALLKEIYQGSLREQLQSEVIGYKRIESTNRGVSQDVGGKYVTFPLRVRRNHGQGYRQENEQLPAAGQQGYASVRIPLKYGYGRVRLTGQLMKLAETNPQSFANAMEKEMDGLKDDTAKDCARIFYGNATGQLAVVTADGANTVTVSNIQYLELDMMIDVITPGTGAVKFSNRKITAIVPGTFPAGTVTYDGADGTAVANDVIVRTGSGTVSAGVFREPNGLGSIIASTGALYNVDPATEPKWASIIDTNGGSNRSLTEEMWIKACDNTRINGGKVSVIFASLGVRRAYFSLLKAQRQFVKAQTFEGGFQGLAFAAGGGDIPVVEDVDCPPNTSFGLQESNFTVYREAEWEFADDDNSVLKWVTDFDAWEAILRRYWELGIDRRNSHFKVGDITET